MTFRRFDRWLLVASFAAVWAPVVACDGPSSKRAAYGGGGEGGEGAASGVGEGGSSVPANNAGEANGNVAGMPDLAGAPNAGAGGAPVDMTPTGGVPSMAGMPSEPTAGAPNVLPQCEGPLTFPDSYVEEQVRAAIGVEVGPITAADVADLTSLAIPFNDSTIDITGIECLQALTALDFSGGGGQEPLSLLAELPNLRSLDLSDGYLSDLTGVDQITQLTSLNVSGNFIGDIGPVASLTNLTDLNLQGIGLFGQVPLDISPLESLTKLKKLDLGQVVIEDGASLSSLPQLQELSISGAKIPSLTPVLGLTNLSSLDLSSLQLTAVPSLTALTKLTKLNASGNSFTDFTALASRTSLTELDLSSTTLSALTSIAPLTALTTLDVSYNALTDVTTLGALPALVSLDISFNSNLTSVHPLVTSNYIGAGDVLDVTGVGDCGATYLTDFNALIAKNVMLQNSCGL